MVRANFTKLYQALGFQRLLPNTNESETISKARHDHICDENNVPNLRDHNINKANVAEECYSSWLSEHPNALSAFKDMMGATMGKRIVVFLDYDGTLSPIVNDPDRAFMSDPMRSAVREVAMHFPTAIISGRSRDKVYEFVKLDEVYYAGSHGMDIIGPPRQLKCYDGKYQTKALDDKGNEFVIFQPAQEFLPEIQEILTELEEKTRSVEGVAIEDNRFCISVHFRNVHEKDYSMLEQIVQSALSKYSGFHLTMGKMVMEIRPSIKWNKGHALEYLLDTLGFANSDDVFPIYIGDDRTDEDAFKVLQSRGQGYSIIVSAIPRDSVASHSLRDPSEVLSFLRHLARRRETSSQ